MKRNILFALCAIVLGVAGYVGYQRVSASSESDLFLDNVEALSSGEKLDCNYVRGEGKCVIEVGAHGKIQLLGGTIIKAGADGIIDLDGKVVCSSGGKAACTPIECKDLYEVLR